MNCTGCGMEMRPEYQFCSRCGKPAGAGAPRPDRPKRLARDMSESKLGGVCAGIARYLNIDVTIVRLLWIVGTFASVGIGILAYIVCWIVMPRNDAVWVAAN